MGKLNAKQINSLTAARDYGDGGGLYLQVKPSGRKSGVFRFKIAGRTRWMAAGQLPEAAECADRLTGAVSTTSRSAIRLPPMRDPNHHYQQHVIVESVDHPPVANSEPVLVAPLHGLHVGRVARIVGEPCQASQDACLDRPI
jgi:hypothetical protein